MMILGVVLPLFGRIRLEIEKEISLTYELFGFKYQHPRSSQRQSISKIERTQKHYTKDSDGDRVTIYPEIIIYAGTQEYKIGSGILSEAELDWLTHELNQWLDVPSEKD